MMRIGRIAIVAALGFLVTVNSYGIVADYIEFEVQGKSYSVPIPNTETRNTFYYVKKALKGDIEAREFVLGGSEKKVIFIGDLGVVRWLTITKDSESIQEIKTGEE